MALIACMAVMAATFARAQEGGANDITSGILGMLNSDLLNNDDRGGMPTDYEYAFPDSCNFKAHSEWYGETHGQIQDAVVPLSDIALSRESEGESLYLYFQCKGGADCISIVGDNSGESYRYGHPYLLVFAGRTDQSYRDLKTRFDLLISRCDRG